MKKAAEVYEPKTGRVMEVLTDEPGLQFYTGNFLDGTITGKGGEYLRAARGILHGDAALSGLAEQAEVPEHEAGPGKDVPHRDDVQVLDAVVNLSPVVVRNALC